MAEILATEPYRPLAQAIVAEREHYRLTEVERRHFPDGERYLRILSDCRNQDVVILGGSIDDASTLELFDLGCTAVALGARSLSLFMPFFGYQTMERAVRSGEVVTAKTRAQLLSAIPPASRGNHIFLLDLHAEGIPHYFAGHVHAVHVYAKRLIRSLILDVVGDSDWMLGATDAGRAKWVESLANDFHVDAGFVFKRRLDGSTVETSALAANVDAKHVVIYDDMIRSGSTLIAAAEAYRAAGAAKISVVATHGVFVEGAVERLSASGLIDGIACTDSHPRARPEAERASDFVRIASIRDVMLDHLDHYLP